MPEIDRKGFLRLLGVTATGLALGCRDEAVQSGSKAESEKEATVEERVARIIREYDAQGIHRTGTEGDQECARWLAEEARVLGAEVELEGLSFERIDIVQCFVEIEGGERIEAVPVYNTVRTGQDGVRGLAADEGSEGAAIGFRAVAPNGSGSAEIHAFRASAPWQAVVAVTGGERFGLPPGLALINAEGYASPTSPPTVHVGSESLGALEDAARTGRPVRVVNHWNKTATEVFNTVATLVGRRPELEPLMVMTPRSGWWRCASERGGGIAVWLEMMRALAEAKVDRTVHFVASTGHELGHYGLEDYLEKRHELISSAVAWVHLGANFGTAVGGGLLFQASDEEMRTLVLEAMARYGREPARETPVGERALGEARNIFDGGGRFFSLIGTNGLFHHPSDRWPEAVDVAAVAAIARAFSEVAIELAGPGQPSELAQG